MASAVGTLGFWMMLGLMLVLMHPLPVRSTSKYSNYFDITYGFANVRSVSKDRIWELLLDNSSSAGIESKQSYLYGSFQISMKLPSGNSAGTVTAFYLSSNGADQDEVDFEFLGNETGQPYILQTNVFWNGTYGREQRIYLWFDPSEAYHTYSIIWNLNQTIVAVDGIPIRIVKNNEKVGIPYLRHPMSVHGSIWDGSTWATQGGRIKIDYSNAPFVATFGKFKFDVCKKVTAKCLSAKWWNSPAYSALTADQLAKFQWVRNSYLVYNYCDDRIRYPEPFPECFI